jgi:hypothetical protein
LAGELAALFALWPEGQWGRIARVLYSPPDWDDHPHKVAVGQRFVKTGSFPRDDTHLLIIRTSTQRRLILSVIAPTSTPSDAKTAMTGAEGTHVQPC